MNLESLRRHPAFMRLWVARLAGTTGNQMLMLALGWQMYDLTGSAWDLGLVGLLQFLPAIPLVLPAGQAVDRYHRARLLAAGLTCQAVVAFALAWSSAAGAVTREGLFVVAVLLGVLRSFQLPTQQALTPCLVPAALLPRALAFSATGLQAAIIAGPAIGGLIYVAGPAPTYGSCAALFALSTLIVLLGVHYEHRPPSRQPGWSDLLAGLRFVFAHKVVLGAISLDLFAVLLGGATALLPMFAKDVLQVGTVGLGVLRAAPAVGALVVSVLLTRWPIRRRTGLTLLGAVGLYGLTIVVFGLSTSFWLSAAMLAIGGGADMISIVIRQTLVQLETPDDMRGRVSAVNSVFIGASNQLGEFESGATAAWFGAVGAVVVGGVGTLLVALLWWRLFPPLARRDQLVAGGRD